MELPRRRRPEPAAIDITWVSCRGVRSSLPFHTPCLYASIFVAPSSARGVHGSRRPHRVKTPTDRAGGANPEWDAPLRLYLPVEASPPPPEAEAAGKDKKDDTAGGGGDDDDVLLLRFDIKAEVAVLGDKLTASAAVPVPGLVADGRTRRVSYQLAGPDGRQPNGVISFSYAFHRRNNGDDDGHSSSDDGEGQLVAVTPSPCSTESSTTSPVAHSPPTTPASPCSTESSTTTSPVAHSPPTPTAPASPRLYPAIDPWPPLAPEQMLPAPIYPPPPPVTRPDAAAVTVASSRCYPPPPPATPVEPVSAVYPPLPETAKTSSCSVYPPPPAGAEAVPASVMYPTVDLAPVSCYPPPPALYGVECGYAAAAPGWGWDDRCLYG
ncbi:unnamed protein product [Urochloa decumbens]|uniref:C2 domain-containing protein n=1 Tax=Urochloa decumbens TaxID=240449 RepID=A0ABC9CJ93_9POAL